MSTTKNYGLAGIGADVQLGKGGGRLVWTPGSSDFKFTTDGTTLAHLQVLDPVDATDVATKNYVDSVAAGLDPKQSVRVATTGNITTYNASGGPAATGQFTSAPSAIDGVTLAEGDRILVKSQSTPTQNGIYVVTATTTTWNRAPDMDGTPANEVSGGNFVFVEQGTVNANSGWVLQGNGTLTLNTDNLNWVLFSASSDLAAGVGLVKNGNAFDLDFSELTSQTTIATSDELIFSDAGVESRITVANFLADRDIVTATADGILTRTANDTYASRTLTASSTAAEVGIVITNGNGVSGNPTIGVDINGTAALTDAVATGDTLLLYNAANGGQAVGNYKVTVDQLKTFMNAGTSSSSITEGNSTVAVADAGTGSVTFTLDGTAVLAVTAATTTFQNGNDVVLNTGSTLTVTDLGADRVVFTTTAGLLTSSTNWTFNGTTWNLTAAANITGDLDVDNININGNAITVTNTNGNLDLSANGTGDTRILDGAGNEIAEFLNGSTAVNHLAFQAGATGVAPTISSNVTGAETNVDIGFVLKGTGVLTVTAGSGNYEDNVTADDDIPNKLYVDNAISTAQSGRLDSISATVNFTSASTQSIGTIPANATVLSVTLRVGTASDAATTVTVGDATNGATSYMAATENDPQQANTTFVADTYVLNGGSNVTANATVATAGTVGSGTVVVTFRYA